MNYSDEDIKLCAKKGATWMDESISNWATFIDLSNLEMSNCDYCIIGQAIGEYDAVVEEYGYNTAWAVEHGFIAPSQFHANGQYDDLTTSKYYHKLEQAWAEEVMSRR